jgi:hypothetical protein
MGDYLRRMMAGPGSMRFILQPTVAVLLGVWHGIVDAGLGRPPYLAGLIDARGERGAWLRRGLRAITVPFALALVASVAFQYIEMERVRLVLALLYAAIFVAVPYSIARSLANRVARSRPTHGRHA